ncbi:MAG: peptide-binding protein [Desulfobacterota bacterium]|nr:peptide-binding protein [Thermodesulfobacteriota bacterium]MDW8001552.1 peptide-binding protein [Deltaproteobacteria bacterium]
MKNLKTVVAFLLLFFFLFGCSPGKRKVSYEDEGKPAYGDALITASLGEPTNLIPILTTDAPSHDVAARIYNGLVKYDKDLRIVGDLAESWSVSRDNLIITFRLKKNVKWHDGKPFTAKDVLYTYKVITDPKTPTAYSSDFLEVKKAEVIDDYTFRVTYHRPFAPGLISWAISILPSHLLDGQDITRSPLLRNPIGTGPYKFKEWVAGQRIVLLANEDYFGGRPYIERHIIRFIPDSASMFLELKNSRIDMMGLSPLQYLRQTDYPAFKREFNKYQYLSFSYVYLGYNLKHPFFKEKAVRQALTHAIDKREIIEGVLLGQGIEAHGPYKPDMWAYNPQVKRYEYDKEKAKKLLESCGFVRGKDGILEKDGKRFEFTILVNQGNDVRIRCAELIQKRLAEIGVKVKIRVLEWASLINEFIDKRNFEAVILGWTIPHDPDLFDIWHSSKQGKKELNFISFENKEVDELLVRARHTFNIEERKRYYFRFQEILAEEQPYTFLFIPYANVAIHKRIKGVSPAPLGITYNMEKWYVPYEQMRYKSHVTVYP